MRIAVSGFAATERWQDNLEKVTHLIASAEEGGADLLVLPEGVLARFTEDLARIRQAAQPLDGPFVDGVLAATRGRRCTVVVGIHEATEQDRVFNTLVVARDGRQEALYRKLHLFDAFGSLESDHVLAGDELPPVISVGGLQVGLLTCYDVRFPEVARLLVDRGADVLALPTAWVRGPLKERHWELMVAARALENTCYVAASGECGSRNIGTSMVVDPLGTVTARLGQEEGTLWAEASRERLDGVRAALPVLANRRFAVHPAPDSPAHRPGTGH